jgi:hypothetical protein
MNATTTFHLVWVNGTRPAAEKSRAWHLETASMRVPAQYFPRQTYSNRNTRFCASWRIQ